MTKYVFLDIDGPVIPEGCYYINRNASFDRTFSNVCIGYVKKLLDLSGAKLVTNSMHNYHTRTDDAYEKLGDLREDLIAAGIPEDAFVGAWRTQFGHNTFNTHSWRGDQPHPRLKAINQWLDNFAKPGDEWLGFDDEDYRSPNLLLVDFNDGITHALFREACDRFSVKVPVIL